MRLTAYVLAVAALPLAGAAVSPAAAGSAPRHAYVPCFKSSSGVGAIVLKERPTVCLSQSVDENGVAGGNAGLRDLRQLRWRKWGSSSTFASGRSYDLKYGPNGKLGFQRVTVTLSGLTSGGVACNYRRFYSHLRVRSPLGVGEFDLVPTCAA